LESLAATSDTVDPQSTGEPFNILHFFPRIRREEGGVVQAILDLCQLMANAGHVVILATCDGSDLPDAWRDSNHNPHAVVLERSSLISSRLSSKGIHNFKALSHFADVVHLHTPWELSNLQIAPLLRSQGLPFAPSVRSKGVPYIVTVHGMLDDYCMQQKSLKKRVFLNLGGRKLFSNATTVHFTAAAERDQATRWIPGNYQPVVQACAIDFAPYEQLPGIAPALAAFPQLKTDSSNILFLSRVHPKKGVERLIEAVGLLKEQHKNLQLLVAGPGEEAYAKELKDLAQTSGIGQFTHFLGMVRGDVKLSLYELADVFVLPTHQENFGLVLPEALACGTPVVTTRGTDIWRELAEAGAKIVDNEPRAIADAIAGLLADDAAREQLGRQGRDYVRNWLAEDKVQAGYERMYADTVLLGSKGR
jgi:glycosyltransferase involved in cell wall biosynthesis